MASPHNTTDGFKANYLGGLGKGLGLGTGIVATVFAASVALKDDVQPTHTPNVANDDNVTVVVKKEPKAALPLEGTNNFPQLSTTETAVALKDVTEHSQNFSPETESHFKCDDPAFLDGTLSVYVSNDGEDARGTSLGSGFIVSSDGLAYTNHHVVDAFIDGKADKIEVVLYSPDGSAKPIPAQLIGYDHSSRMDLAILRLDPESAPLDNGLFPCVEMGDSDDVHILDTVVAFGNPYGYANSASQGIVSNPNRYDEELSQFYNMIQTDAAINRGNSGGALFNDQNQVIGINTQIFSSGGGSIGLGFALRINDAFNVANEIMDNAVFDNGELVNEGRGQYARLGSLVLPITEEKSTELGYDEPLSYGIVIDPVEGGPAAEAGLQKDDIIREVNGVPFKGDHSLFARHIGVDFEPGNEITFKVIRDKEVIEVAVTLGRLPDPDATAQPQSAPGPKPEPKPDSEKGEAPEGEASPDIFDPENWGPAPGE